MRVFTKSARLKCKKSHRICYDAVAYISCYTGCGIDSPPPHGGSPLAGANASHLSNRAYCPAPRGTLNGAVARFPLRAAPMLLRRVACSSTARQVCRAQGRQTCHRQVCPTLLQSVASSPYIRVDTKQVLLLRVRPVLYTGCGTRTHTLVELDFESSASTIPPSRRDEVRELNKERALVSSLKRDMRFEKQNFRGRLR